MSGPGWYYGQPGYDRPETPDEIAARMQRQADIQAKVTKKQVGGDHYKKRAIQPIHYILENDLPFIEGNVVKYITRWRDKGGINDLHKARHYIDILIEHELKMVEKEIDRCEGKKDQ